MTFEPHESNSLNHARARVAAFAKIEAGLTCRCGAVNTPAQTEIVLELNGWANCGRCKASWRAVELGR